MKFEAGGDTKGTFYKRFFSEAPSTFVARNLRDQCEQTRDRIVPEIRKQAETSLLHPFADRLQDFARGALTSLTVRTKARGEKATVASDVTDWVATVSRGVAGAVGAGRGGSVTPDPGPAGGAGRVLRGRGAGRAAGRRGQVSGS